MNQWTTKIDGGSITAGTISTGGVTLGNIPSSPLIPLKLPESYTVAKSGKLSVKKEELEAKPLKKVEMRRGAFYPVIAKVAGNAPATVVFFKGLTGDPINRVVAMCHEGDKYDRLRGVLTCVLRKTMRNRTMGPKMEKVVKCIAKKKLSPKELRALGRALLAVADWQEDK